jgi:hypothetical protein
MPDQKHTPTPWRLSGESPSIFVDQLGRLIGSSCGWTGTWCYPPDREGIANAAFIVCACNAHDALVEAAEHTLQLAGRFAGQLTFEDLKPLRAALKLAEPKMTTGPKVGSNDVVKP